MFYSFLRLILLHIATHSNHNSTLYYGRGYFPEVFREIAAYFPRDIRGLSSYFQEVFWKITSSLYYTYVTKH
jgi:hypothetical protein